jgi:hypothetical protein
MRILIPSCLAFIPIVLMINTSVQADSHLAPRSIGEVTKADLCNIFPDAECLWVQGHEILSFVRDGSDVVIQANHKPTPGEDVASTMLAGEWVLPSINTETWLSYEIMFAEDFKFANGGKIHGIGGGTTPTGGSHQRDGMSARMMWKDGKLKLYMYHLNMESKWGDYFDTGHTIIPGEWIRIAIHVDIGTTERSGLVEVYIEGMLTVNEEIFFKSSSDDLDDTWKPDRLMLSSFHGGSGKEDKWVPQHVSTTYVKNFKYGAHKSNTDL